MYIREGGFIENAEFFDASFFRISLAEVRNCLKRLSQPLKRFLHFIVKAQGKFKTFFCVSCLCRCSGV